MKRPSVSFFGVLCGIALLLGGCDPSTPSRVETGKIRIVEETVTKTMPAYPVEDPRLKAIADHYAANNKGPITLTVSYDQTNPNGRKEAERQIKAFENSFRKHGVTALKTASVAVDEIYAGQAVVSYRARVAKPPEDCTRVVGYQGAGRISDVDDYQFGCENAAVFSKMISRVDDLKGNAGAQSIESRRTGTMAEPYASGTPNDPIGGFSASDIGVNAGGG